MPASRLARVLRVVHHVENGLLAFALGLLVVMGVGQIVARLFFDSGWVWVDPAMRSLILWLAMLGALAATRDKQHIAIDLLPRYLPPLGRRIAWAIGQLFAAGICALLAWGSVDLVLLERESGASLIADLPTWVSLLILPFGFGLMGLRLILAAFLSPPDDAHVA